VRQRSFSEQWADGGYTECGWWMVRAVRIRILTWSSCAISHRYQTIETFHCQCSLPTTTAHSLSHWLLLVAPPILHSHLFSRPPDHCPSQTVLPAKLSTQSAHWLSDPLIQFIPPTNPIFPTLLRSPHGYICSEMESLPPPRVPLLLCWLDCQNLGSQRFHTHFILRFR
jgi:hypothetical protein